MIDKDLSEISQLSREIGSLDPWDNTYGDKKRKLELARGGIDKFGEDVRPEIHSWVKKLHLQKLQLLWMNGQGDEAERETQSLIDKYCAAGPERDELYAAQAGMIMVEHARDSGFAEQFLDDFCWFIEQFSSSAVPEVRRMVSVAQLLLIRFNDIPEEIIADCESMQEMHEGSQDPQVIDNLIMACFYHAVNLCNVGRGRDAVAEYVQLWQKYSKVEDLQCRVRLAALTLAFYRFERPGVSPLRGIEAGNRVKEWLRPVETDPQFQTFAVFSRVVVGLNLERAGDHAAAIARHEPTLAKYHGTTHASTITFLSWAALSLGRCQASLWEYAQALKSFELAKHFQPENYPDVRFSREDHEVLERSFTLACCGIIELMALQDAQTLNMTDSEAMDILEANINKFPVSFDLSYEQEQPGAVSKALFAAALFQINSGRIEQARNTQGIMNFYRGESDPATSERISDLQRILDQPPYANTDKDR